jgi:hypothetical protein
MNDISATERHFALPATRSKQLQEWRTHGEASKKPEAIKPEKDRDQNAK